DNVLSVWRIVDRAMVQKPPNWDGKTPIALQIHGLISFKSGDTKGQHQLRLVLESPNGKRAKMFEHPIEFAGGDTGINIRINLAMGVTQKGRHLIDVYIDKWLATRVFLTVDLSETAPPQNSTQRPSGSLKRI